MKEMMKEGFARIAVNAVKPPVAAAGGNKAAQVVKKK